MHGSKQIQHGELMSGKILTIEEARRLVGEVFVYHMPFNRLIGLELRRFEHEVVEIAIANQDKLVGNAAQHILHGGVIASILDVTAGLVCVGSTLIRFESITEELLKDRMSRMGTIDMRVDYLRPGRGEYFVATANLLRSGNKIAVARVELHNEAQLHIATATATYMVG